ncbi:hypothetical protein FHS59_002550 [Algoriphagus iocasae]|uniref:Uncharacterized protein n=1 Tax=Algoriphagus iocasae TaxID=1836499 RepID=A0A841MFJ8_9BACT|nr:hypothetical protein [Algoriphagus iocasae]
MKYYIKKKYDSLSANYILESLSAVKTNPAI